MGRRAAPGRRQAAAVRGGDRRVRVRGLERRVVTAVVCRVCGRRLRSETWRARGIGPVCARRTRSGPGRTPTTTDTEPIPGQQEIPLPPMQHTLTWSP
ncbi:DUF6011 domain-containing protein [Kitasatospora albolonga]|uniref:DUF6011 domain-containing protein n=1 Tax=Kitasatospora albolonga TaxID=68173 RepID=UPI0039BD3956